MGKTWKDSRSFKNEGNAKRTTEKKIKKPYLDKPDVEYKPSKLKYNASDIDE